MLFKSKLRKFGYSVTQRGRARREALYDALSSIGKIGILGELHGSYYFGVIILFNLKKVFDKYRAVDWRSPFMAIVPTRNKAKELAEAIWFFHGDKAKTTPVEVSLRHKERLVWMKGKAYRVISKGYQVW